MSPELERVADHKDEIDLLFSFLSFPSGEKGREGLHLMLVRFSGLPCLQNCEPNERLIYKLPSLWYFVIVSENGFR